MHSTRQCLSQVNVSVQFLNEVMLSLMQTQKISHLQGFTLAETLISVSLMALLMGIALPSLETHWQHARRQDAQNTLLQLHLRQLQWRGLHPEFSSQLPDLDWANPHSSAGHYRLNLESVSAQAYVLHATAIGLQARDAACQVMSLRVSEASPLLRTSNEFLLSDPGRCWK